MTPVAPDLQSQQQPSPGTQPAFYITGGTLPPGAPSYVAREADDALFHALLAANTCYVLNARQMGKSSLCVRTIERLNAANVRTVFLDLTKFGGRNLTAEQWYAALLAEIGRELNVRPAMLSAWKEQSHLPPVQRLFEALVSVALPAASTPLVVFVDEIDVTRVLPFSTDEFFAAIRHLVVGRAADPQLQGVSFCLLGTATPADLIEDVSITPFNVGTRIELRDFTEAEAAPLAAGLSASSPALGQALLGRVLYWTGGQPYMTQRLCEALRTRGAQSAGDVDVAVSELFLSRAARDADDNLANVRNRLLKGSDDVASLLEMYGAVLAGKSVVDEENDPKCGILKLSGVLKSEGGLLRVRNRIYASAFDRRWIASSLPDAEVRRQREAYRKGVARTAAFAGAIIAIVGCLAAFALTQARLATKNAHLAAKNAARANQNATNETVARAAADRNARQARSNEQTAQQANRAKGVALQQAQQQTLLAGQRLQAMQQANVAKDAALRQARQSAAQAKQQAQIASRNALVATDNARRAERETGFATTEATRARRAEQEALRQKDSADHNLYVANMNLVQTEWENNNISHMRDLLDATRTSKFRGFEWGYWDRLCHLELVTFKGTTTAQIESVAFSPDGKRIVTGCNGGTKVWDAQNGQELLTLKEPVSAQVESVAFSPDGKRIVTGSEVLLTAGSKGTAGSPKGTVQVWDAQTGQELLTLKEYTNQVNSVAFSPDGKRIVIGSGFGTVDSDNTAKVWDAQSGQELLTLKETGTSASFSSDGRRIVTSGDDHTAKVWDAQSGQKLLTLAGASTCASFSPDGKYVVTGISLPSPDSSNNASAAKVWDAQNGQEVLTLKGHTGSVSSAAFSSDGNSIVTGSNDHTAKVWNARTGQNLLTLTGHTDPVISVAFSPDGKRIVTSSYDGTAKIWDARSDREVLTFKAQTNPVHLVAFSVHSVAFFPDGKHIVTSSWDRAKGDWDGAARVLDLQTGQVTLTLKVHSSIVISADFSPDGKRFVTGSWDSTATVWDAQSGQKLLTLTGYHTGQIYSVAFSPDGKRIVTGSQDGTARIWDAQSGQKLFTLTVDGSGVNSVVYSPDGRRIATDGLSGTKVWDAQSGRKLLTLENDKSITADNGFHLVYSDAFLPNGKRIFTNGFHQVYSAAFSPDGRRIVTGSWDSTAKVWDAQTGQELLTLTGHTDPVVSVAFSPDGKRIVTSSYDGTAKVWDAQSGQELLALKGHTDGVMSAAFSLDGKRILTTSLDGTVKEWFSDVDDAKTVFDQP